MLDADLATLYMLETKALNRAVKRNLGRFPGDFTFELTNEGFEVPYWYLKLGERRPAVAAVRFHRTRCCHALFRAQQSAGRPNEHSYHAGLSCGRSSNFAT